MIDLHLRFGCFFSTSYPFKFFRYLLIKAVVFLFIFNVSIMVYYSDIWCTSFWIRTGYPSQLGMGI